MTILSTGPADSSGTSGSSDWNSIEEIADAVRACTECRLHSGRTNAVPGDGSPVASILIIGEGPGFNEDQQGLPFVGRSGKLLDELLAEVPLSRKDVFITNVVKCRPPDNRDPQPDEVAACRPFLERQMELLDPKVIVTLGRHSLLRFYPDGKISKDHGKILRWNGRILFPLYHPAAGLRNPAIKRDLQQDVLRLPEALRESLKPNAPPVTEQLPEPSTGQAAASAEVEPAEPEQPGPSSEQAQSENTGESQPVAPAAAAPPTKTPVPVAPLASSDDSQSVGTSVSEPIIENETTEKEQGDRQLGFF